MVVVQLNISPQTYDFFSAEYLVLKSSFFVFFRPVRLWFVRFVF